MNAQSLDTAKYTSYKSQPILYFDLGYNAAPFSMKYRFTENFHKVKYRHNFKTMIGIGFAYKWFSLRLGAAVIGNARPISRFGKANYYDVGLNFSIKKTYSEIDLRTYSGYVVENSKLWDTTYNNLRPNDIDQDITTYNVALSMWYFDNDNFKIDPFNGIRGRYNKPVTTWYLAGRFDVYGVVNRNGNSIVPVQLVDSANTKTGSSSLTAGDFGVIPGVGHAGRLKNWQYGAMFALGPRIQTKTYNVNSATTTLLGVVLRYDVKLIVGYNIPKFFSLLSFELDSKSISFNSFKYYQSFYRFRLTIGYRFKEKDKNKK